MRNRILLFILKLIGCTVLNGQACINQEVYCINHQDCESCTRDCISNHQFDGLKTIRFPLKVHTYNQNNSALDNLDLLIESTNSLFSQAGFPVEFYFEGSPTIHTSLPNDYCAFYPSGGTCDCDITGGSTYFDVLSISSSSNFRNSINVFLFETLYTELSSSSSPCNSLDYDLPFGLASYPTIDPNGINNHILLTNSTVSTFGNGVIFAHELGHIFGLYHTFENNSFNGNTSLDLCQGDGISDTPHDLNGSVSFPSCNFMDYNLENPDAVLGGPFSSCGINRNITQCQEAKMIDVLFECRNNICSKPEAPKLYINGVEIAVSPHQEELYVFSENCDVLTLSADLSENPNRTNTNNCVIWEVCEYNRFSGACDFISLNNNEPTNSIDIKEFQEGIYIFKVYDRAPYNGDCTGDFAEFVVSINDLSDNCDANDCFTTTQGCIDLCSSIECNVNNTYDIEVSINPDDTNLEGCSLVLYDPDTYGGYSSSVYATPVQGISPNQYDNIVIGECYTFSNIPEGMRIGVQAQMFDSTMEICEEDGTDLCFNTWENNEYAAPSCSSDGNDDLECTVPEFPRFAASAQSQIALILWNSATDAVGYDVCWGYDSSASICTTVVNNQLSLPSSVIEPCEQFLYYKVRTVCSNGLKSAYTQLKQETMADEFNCELDCGLVEFSVFSIDCRSIVNSIQPHVDVSITVSDQSHVFSVNAGDDTEYFPATGNDLIAYVGVKYQLTNGEICITVTDETADCSEEICIEEICDCGLGRFGQGPFLEIDCQDEGGFRVDFRDFPENRPYFVEDNQGAVAEISGSFASFPRSNDDCYQIPLPDNGLAFTASRVNLPSCVLNFQVTAADIANCEEKCIQSFFYIPEDITVSCISNPLSQNFTGTAYTTCAACSAPVSSITDDLGCNGTGIVTRQWTYTDECGTLHEQTQVITITDSEAPFIIAPEDISISSCSNISDLSIVGNYLLASDNCTSSLTPTYADSGTLSVGNTITRTWTVLDDCGNSASDVQLITIDSDCATCTDGIENGDEEGIDCGGSCKPCVCENILAINTTYDCDNNTVDVSIPPPNNIPNPNFYTINAGAGNFTSNPNFVFFQNIAYSADSNDEVTFVITNSSDGCEYTFTETVGPCDNDCGADQATLDFQCFFEGFAVTIQTNDAGEIYTSSDNDGNTSGTFANSIGWPRSGATNYTYADLPLQLCITKANDANCQECFVITVAMVNDAGCSGPDNTASLADPCSCTNPQNYSLNGTYYFKETVEITGTTGQSWNMTSITTGGIFDSSGTAIPLPFLGTETPAGSGIYQWEFWHVDGTGFCADYEEAGGMTLDNCNSCDLPAAVLPLSTDLGLYSCMDVASIPACPTTVAEAMADPYNISLSEMDCDDLFAISCADSEAVDCDGGMQEICRTVTLIYDVNDNGIQDVDEETSEVKYTFQTMPVNNPTLRCRNTSVKLNASGVASITPADLVTNTGGFCSDNLSYRASKRNFDCSDLEGKGIEIMEYVTIIVTDDCNNSAICRVMISLMPDYMLASLEECSCDASKNYTSNGVEYFHRVDKVVGSIGQNWTLESITGNAIYDMNGNPIALPLSGTHIGCGVFIWEYWHTNAGRHEAIYSDSVSGSTRRYGSR